jgi:hypothetical protein
VWRLIDPQSATWLLLQVSSQLTPRCPASSFTTAANCTVLLAMIEAGGAISPDAKAILGVPG